MALPQGYGPQALLAEHMGKPVFKDLYPLPPDGFYSGFRRLETIGGRIEAAEEAMAPECRSSEVGLRGLLLGQQLVLPKDSEYRAIMKDNGQVFTGADLEGPLQARVRTFRVLPCDFHEGANLGQHGVRTPAAEVHLGVSFRGTVSFGSGLFKGFKKRARELDIVIPADSVFSTLNGGFVLGDVAGTEKRGLDPVLLELTAEKLNALRDLKLGAQAAGQRIAGAVHRGLAKHRGGPVVVRSGFANGSCRRQDIVGQVVGFAGVEPKSGQVRLSVEHPAGHAYSDFGVDTHSKVSAVRRVSLPGHGENTWVSQGRVSAMAERALMALKAK